MSKDIVKSSAEFVYVNKPNRTIRAQVQIGNPFCGLPQWNPLLEVFIQDPNGLPIEKLGFNPSRIVSDYIQPGQEWANKPMLGLGNQDMIPNSFNGLTLTNVRENSSGEFIILPSDKRQVPAGTIGALQYDDGNWYVLVDQPKRQVPAGTIDSFQESDGNWYVLIDEANICKVSLQGRGNPDDAIANIIFSDFASENTGISCDIFIKYSYECDGVSKHKHSVWGMLCLMPDPITSTQVMWFVNS